LSIYDGEENRAVAVRGLAPSFADRLRKGFRPGPEHPVRQLLDGARVVQVPDLAESADPIARASFELAGSRTVLLVPLRKDDRLLGQIVLLRVRLRQLPNAADRGSTSRDRGRLPLKPIDRSTAANVAKGARAVIGG
jgi:GAF domain-containing protein